MLATGFVPNAQGRALATGLANAIAVLVTEPLDELFVDPTYSTILKGITDGLASTPFLPMLLQAHSDDERARALQHFDRRSFDAVISLSPYVGGDVLEALSRGDLPVVLCGQLEGMPYEGVFSTVYADDVEGSRIAAERMLAQGRTRVGAILGPFDNPASVDRHRGYHSVLGERLQDDAVVYTGWDSNSGFEAARELLETVPEIDGILAGSDRIAVGALTALRLAGRRVPEDVSVIGFDNHPFAATSTPPLTTIEQPLHDEGRVAAEMALGMIDGADPRTEVLHMSLVERESC
nr:LacI family DNA-binding transcriptional regulator [Tessaracoccus sp. OS52]